MSLCDNDYAIGEARMIDWFQTFDESLWLRPDETGEADAQFIMLALHLQPGDRVLDLPCGAGRVGVWLAKAGCRVTGVDRNPSFVGRAQRRFADEGVDGEFRALDMRCLDDGDAFDGIYNWSGSFGYCTDEENLDVLRRMVNALKPGGRVLIDQPNREWLLRHFLPVIQLPTGHSENRWIPETQRIESYWHAAEAGTVSTSSMRLYTTMQFRRLFAQAGLIWEAAYGGKDGSAYTRGSRRLIVVGRK